MRFLSITILSKSGFWSRKPKTESQKKKNAKTWDKVHTALDIAGLVPGIGNVADGVNAGLHAARGNWKDAALSAASMIPGAGQAATAARIAKKSGKAIKGATKAIKGSTKVAKGTKKVVKGTKKVVKGTKQVVKAIKDESLEKTKGVREFFERALKKKGKKKTSSNLKEFKEKTVLDRQHTNKKGKTETVKTTHESYDVAKKVFEKETGFKPGDTGQTNAKTMDGKYHLTVRDKSKSKGEPTLDIKTIESGDVTKIRCQGACKQP